MSDTSRLEITMRPADYERNRAMFEDAWGEPETEDDVGRGLRTYGWDEMQFAWMNEIIEAIDGPFQAFQYAQYDTTAWVAASCGRETRYADSINESPGAPVVITTDPEGDDLVESGSRRAATAYWDTLTRARAIWNES